ncbi:hypothetical protein QQ045_000195 [Rhodiola kirilowii]
MKHLMKKHKLFHPPLYLLHSHISSPLLKPSVAAPPLEKVRWKLTMDKSWMRLERGDSCYIQRLVDFVEFAKQIGEKTHLCPCRKYLLVRGRISTNEMVVHLINNGMMNSYNTWTSHDERSIDPSAYQLRQEWLKERYGETSSSATHHQANRILEILHDQFPFRHIHEEDHMNINAEDGDSESILAYEWYTNLVGEVQTPLYKGCDHTVLETILRAMQMKIESRLSDKGFDKMLHNTKKILPPDNNYPGSYKDVKKVLRDMGLGYMLASMDVCYTTKGWVKPRLLYTKVVTIPYLKLF